MFGREHMERKRNSFGERRKQGWNGGTVKGEEDVNGGPRGGVVNEGVKWSKWREINE